MAVCDQKLFRFYMKKPENVKIDIDSSDAFQEYQVNQVENRK